MTPEGEPERLAVVACLSCRNSKRRCDRTLPECSLCRRREVQCRYPARRAPALPPQAHGAIALTTDSPSSEQHSWTRQRESPYAAESDPNAIYFIAPRLFQQARLGLVQPYLPIPTYVSEVIGDAAAIRGIAATFFTTVHRWLPLLSKRGFFEHLLNPLASRRIELSLLALCMKLCCSCPKDDDWDSSVGTGLYHAAKRFHHEVTAAGILSIHVLQAEILIAIYELGQAVYPAAYLTVGACARYGLALGTDRSALRRGDEDDMLHCWSETEERRRAWWTVLMLDRYLSFHDPNRPLSTEDPTFETYLPVDDDAWDKLKAKPGDAVTISTGFTLKMGSYARLAQATYLLSQALRSISTPPVDGETPVQDDQTAQLRRTLLALVHATDREATVRRLEFCAQSELCMSTLLLLEEHRLQEWEANAPDDHPQLPFDCLWSETRTSLDRLVAAAESYSISCPLQPESSDSIPIFLIHVMYQVARMFGRFCPIIADDGMTTHVNTVKRLLRLVSSRWRLAAVYLTILEAQLVTASTDII